MIQGTRYLSLHRESQSIQDSTISYSRQSPPIAFFFPFNSHFSLLPSPIRPKDLIEHLRHSQSVTMASTSKSLTLSVRPRGKQSFLRPPGPRPPIGPNGIIPPGKPARKLPEEVSLTSNGSTFDLYHEIARRAGTSVHRLRITKGSDGSVVPNAKSLSVHSTGLREQSTVYVKDLGESLTALVPPCLYH